MRERISRQINQSIPILHLGWGDQEGAKMGQGRNIVGIDFGIGPIPITLFPFRDLLHDDVRQQRNKNAIPSIGFCEETEGGEHMAIPVA